MPTFRNYPDRRARYDKLKAALWSERQAGFDSHWRSLGDFFMPRRMRFTLSDRNKGDRRNNNIINSTGLFAAQTLSSGLHAGLTSPARPWMKLTTPDPELAKYGPVKVWLHTVNARMLQMYATTNIYNILPLSYLDMGIFGTSAMSVLPDSKDIFRCYSYPLGSYALGLDARGRITTFVHEFQWTVRQVVEEFGVQPNGVDIDWSTISSGVKSLWDRGDYEQTVDVTWLVMPNELHDPKWLDSKYKRWISCYWEIGRQEKPFLRESGYDTFPIMAARWDVTAGDSYGTNAPGITALGDNKQLQIQEKKIGKLLEKAVDPPLRAPSSLLTQKPSLMSGDVTYVDVREGMQGLAPIHEVRLEGYQHLSNDILRVEQRIDRAFFTDLFLMMQRSDLQMGAARPTAREVDERSQEKLIVLGPVLERTNDELLDPLVDRTFAMMQKEGFFPEPPKELGGVQLRVEYISILAVAQKMVGVSSLDRFMQTMVALQQSSPDVQAKIDIDQVVDEYADSLGVNPRIIRPTDQAEQIRAQQRQAQQNAVAAEQAASLGKAMKDASQAPLTGDTALNAIIQAAAHSPGMVQ